MLHRLTSLPTSFYHTKCDGVFDSARQQSIHVIESKRVAEVRLSITGRCIEGGLTRRLHRDFVQGASGALGAWMPGNLGLEQGDKVPGRLNTRVSSVAIPPTWASRAFCHMALGTG